jgi:Undecaprenyl-phosphate galactose phosphotransferase WbaP
MPGQSSRKLLAITERVGGAFPHLLVIPDLIGFASSGVPAREIAGVVGVEVRQQLLLSGPRFAKRLMDLFLAGLGGIFILPIIAFLALLIRLDSKGSALYTQKRLGQGGKLFTAFKFRTMHGDGEERLKALLDADSKLRAEYDEFHKLTRDPRITRVGRVLRKYSLDELPQLLNVLRGDMSLVGPRPYLQREVPEMEHHERIILRSMPGMTGLWQVSDRNATGFAERLKMDVHYVRNWSPWLDLYILARTFGVVIGGTGS